MSETKAETEAGTEAETEILETPAPVAEPKEKRRRSVWPVFFILGFLILAGGEGYLWELHLAQAILESERRQESANQRILLRLELAEADRPRRAQYKGQGAVAGGNVTIVTGFDLALIADGTAGATKAPHSLRS